MKLSSTALLGAAGEHYVMYELLRRNYIAALAPQGAPNLDIVVADTEGNQLCGIQVKTRSGRGGDGGWHMRPKHEQIDVARLFYCFVDFGQPDDRVQVYLIPSGVVARVIADSHSAWLANPGVKGQDRKDSSVRRLLPDYTYAYRPHACPYPRGWLDRYREAWHMLLTVEGVTP